jgi:hypothetical protein
VKPGSRSGVRRENDDVEREFIANRPRSAIFLLVTALPAKLCVVADDPRPVSINVGVAEKVQVTDNTGANVEIGRKGTG